MNVLRVAFAGTPDFAVPALEALLRAHSVVGVLTQPDRPKGRGRQLAASPVKVAALAHGIPVSQPVSLKAEADRADLAAWAPDVLVVVAYGLILPPAALALPRLGCINIHGSLLPRWRGAAPIQRAVLAGDTDTGVTIMLMDAGLDTGPMLLQERISIGADDTGGTLHDRLAALGSSALLEALEKYASGALEPLPQPADGVTYAAKIDKAEALIDWRRDAPDIERQVRAFNPWPIAETRLEGEQLRIYAATAELVDHGSAVAGSGAAGASSRAQGPGPAAPDFDASSPESGTIVAVRDDSVVVACGSGHLALRAVQRPGRRAVAARDFAHGIQLIGRRLG